MLQEEDYFNQPFSMTMQKMPTGVCSTVIRIMRRSSSSLAGCITNRVTVSAARSKRLNTWRNLSAQVNLVTKDASDSAYANTWQIKVMRKAGISLDGATCHNRNIQKHTRHISKQSTAMDGTRHSGVRLASCTTRLTSTEMPLMHTPARYA